MEENKLKALGEKAHSLPLSPGVYLMKDKTGRIIYIGKAKTLKNRVSQYFHRTAGHGDKVRRMLDHVASFDYIVCGSEFEALILECSLIKQHQPKYNILLKDDKGFHYIRVSPRPWRRIDVVSRMEQDGSEYLGPYYTIFSANSTVDEAKTVFRLPRCKKIFPRDWKKSRPCLNHFIGLCSAPCAGKINQQTYEESVDEALEFIRHGTDQAVQRLTTQMDAAAERMEYERAADYRDRIRALRRAAEKQRVTDSRVRDQDVIALAKAPDAACFEVFRFAEGKLYDRQHFMVNAVEVDHQARTEFLQQFYSTRKQIPRQVTLDGVPADRDLLAQWLSHLAGRRVTVSVPQKGDQRRIVEMCHDNAAERLANRRGANRRRLAVLDELALLLGLKQPPTRIEAFDISHTAGSENVAGMVTFVDGRPCKGAYRRFKIRNVQGQDDYASLREVVSRRLDQANKHKDDGNAFGILPDLMLLDGGRGQLDAVLPILQERGLDIPMFGMVKDDRHKTRALVGQQGELDIKAVRSAFILISQIQEEVHRYAVAYHRQRSKKATLKTSLTNIPGVGPARARSLLRGFGGVKAVAQASLEELEATPGIDRRTAGEVYAHFHPADNKE